jgi:hypothetical protein
MSGMTGDAKNKSTARAGRDPLPEVPRQSTRPSSHRTESENDWLKKVYMAAMDNGYLTGFPTNLAEEMQLFEEDDKDKPAPIAQKAKQRLKVRFLNHLAVTFSVYGARNATIIGLLREDIDKDIATIRLARFSGSGECPDLSEAAKKFEIAFKGIHDSDNPEHARHLEEVVFHLHKMRILEATSQLCRSWSDHREKIYNTIAKMSGIYDDDMHAARDTAIGDGIASINGSIQALISERPSSSKKNDGMLEDLILESCKLVNLDGGLIAERLRNVLGSSLGDAIYSSILVLVLPSKSVATFVRFAHALRRLSTVEFKCGHPKPESSCPPSTLSKANHGGSSSVPTQVKTIKIKATQNCPDSASSLGHTQSATDYQPKCHNAQDLHLLNGQAGFGEELADIHPALKGTVSEMVACVLGSRVPEANKVAYYLFGFVACQNEDEVQRLGMLYKLIFTGSESPIAAVTELCKALAQDQIPQFFARHNWEVFRSELPQLEQFLTTPIHERATVFRLVQFLRTVGDTSPPPVLIRDYGFHFCKLREEVQILKDIYQETLDRVGVLRLHHACLRNQLLELVEGAGVQVEHRYRRLLVNQGPLPDIGYMKITSPFKFNKGLFKNGKTKGMWLWIDCYPGGASPSSYFLRSRRATDAARATPPAAVIHP